MGRNLNDIIKRLPAERQTKIAALSLQKVEEMMAHAQTLADIRKAVGKTQTEVAKQLGIKQHAVSQLEKRSDTYVSTLRRFLQSLGMKLELSVVAKDGARVDLPNFLVAASSGIPAKVARDRRPLASAKPAVGAQSRRGSKSASSTTRKKTHAARKLSSVLQDA